MGNRENGPDPQGSQAASHETSIMKLALATSDNSLIELDAPASLEMEFHALRNHSLERLAKLLADEWTDQREKD